MPRSRTWVVALLTGLSMVIACLVSTAPAAHAASKTSSGTLSVKVSGVAGIKPAITITGPKKFKKVIKGSATVKKLAAGKYKISAPVVPVSDGRAIPVSATKLIKVKKGKTVKLTVAYKFVADPVPVKDCSARPNADLTGCDLSSRSLANSNLSGSNLSNANLSGTTLAGANLTSANLANANLSAMTLTGANLTSTNLAGANLAGAISGSISGLPAQLPSDQWRIVNGYLAGPGANLVDAHLEGAMLQGVTLVGANLASAHFQTADLSGSNLQGQNLSSAQLQAATFNGARLDNVTITAAQAAKFVGTFLTGAHMTSAALSGADFTGADLTNADLTSAQLPGATFTSSTMAGTQLAGADLSANTSIGIVGTPASLPNGWILDPSTHGLVLAG